MGENTKVEKSDFERVKRFIGSHAKGFTYSIRWSAQKSLVEKLMTSDFYDSEDGIEEVRQAIAASLRIAAATPVRNRMFELSGIGKDRNEIETLDYLTDENIQAIKDEMMDGQYSVRPKAAPKDPMEALKKQLDGMTREERIAALTKAGLI